MVVSVTVTVTCPPESSELLDEMLGTMIVIVWPPRLIVMVSWAIFLECQSLPQDLWKWHTAWAEEASRPVSMRSQRRILTDKARI